MKTSFAYIDEAVAAVTATGSKIMSTFAGFDIETEVEAGNYKRFKHSSAQIVDSLQKLDIKPLAVIPSSLWRSITREAGLITVDNTGKIALRGGPITDRLQVYMFVTFCVVVALTVVASAAASIYLFDWLLSPDWSNLTKDNTGLAALLVIPLVATVVSIFTVRAALARIIPVMTKAFVKAKGGETKLLYQMHLEAEKRGYSETYAFRFPSPPPAEASILAKIRTDAFLNAQLSISATPEAFHLTDNTVTGILLQEVEEAKRLAALAADPIVAISYNGATVVVAQYGDFPIEKELVDRIVASNSWRAGAGY